MSAVSKFTAVAAAGQRQVDELRVQIRSVLDEISWIETSPPPKDEVKQRIAAAVDREAARFLEQAQLGDLVHRGEISELLSLRGASQLIAGGSVASATLELAPVLSFLFQETIKARLCEALDKSLVDYSEGPATDDRSALLQSARDRLHALEVEEENLVLEAEAAGIEIHRRADANPAIVLSAHEVSLYKFKAIPVHGDYHFGEIESDESLTRSEILARARHALPSEWLQQFELESIEILERADSDDILLDESEPNPPRRTQKQNTSRSGRSIPPPL